MTFKSNVKVRTAELTGPALDWAVAMAMGVAPDTVCPIDNRGMRCFVTRKLGAEVEIPDALV